MAKTNVSQFTLVSYDVWGNPDDGYVVNNLRTEFSDLNITDDATDQDILSYLKMIGWLTTDNPDDVTIEWIDDSIAEISEAEGGMPLGRLTKNM